MSHEENGGTQGVCLNKLCSIDVNLIDDPLESSYRLYFKVKIRLQYESTCCLDSLPVAAWFMGNNNLFYLYYIFTALQDASNYNNA